MLRMRASSSASPAGMEICWSMKLAMPCWRAPGTSVSPIASMVAASSGLKVRSGTPSARAGHQRLAHRLDGRGLVGVQGAERHAFGARLRGRQKHLGAADREGERAGASALDEGASFDRVHAFLPDRPCRAAATVVVTGWREVNAKQQVESSRVDAARDRSGKGQAKARRAAPRAQSLCTKACALPLAKRLAIREPYARLFAGGGASWPMLRRNATFSTARAINRGRCRAATLPV